MKFKMTWRLWVLTVVLVLSLLSIFITPNFLQKGALVTSVEPNSLSFNEGLRKGQVITSIDGRPVNNADEFFQAFKDKFVSNETQKTIIKTTESEVIIFSHQVPEITVSDVQKTNIKFGLDLVGGSRALVQAEEKELSAVEARELVDITENRLNEFGLTDLKVRTVSDLQGNNFMLVEIAGATPEDLESLIAQQGKFEAKIGDEIVFVGGQEKDIASVCRGDPTCAYVEQCSQQSDGTYFCNFRFDIYLTESAARRHAEITQDLDVNFSSQGSYLSERLDLYLDDNLVNSLLISEDLKGRVTTQISVSGSGVGETQELAFENAEEEMHKLQTILITGSLPFKLEIVKLDTISPLLGEEFLKTILIGGIIALIAASLVVFFRYKNIKLSFALILTSFSEIVIILGIASLIEWNLDLPSIAGILATIGTGFDDQIVILDEAKYEKFLSIKQRLKRAFAIILGAYFTALASMLPLLWAGAGLLRGFAFTTLIGITAGVLITRPAFSDIVKSIEG